MSTSISPPTDISKDAPSDEPTPDTQSTEHPQSQPPINDDLTPYTHYLEPEGPLPELVLKLPVPPTGRILDFSLFPSLAPNYDGALAIIIDNLFTPAECASLIALAENSTLPPGNWIPALLNVGGGRQVIYKEVRDTGRIIVDHPGAARRIWERVEPWVRAMGAEKIDRTTEGGRGVLGSVDWMMKERKEKAMKERWVATRLNERLRFLKYGPGQYFKPHQDGSFSTTQTHPHLPEQRSLLTMQLYLSASENLVGGATSFHPYRGMDWSHSLDVAPVPGRVIVFQHAKLIHSGQAVELGQKIALRSDVMYRLEGEEIAKYF